MSLENDFAADAALCIYIDNSALAGSYFADPGAVPAASLSLPAYSSRFSYAPPARPLPYGLTTSAASQGFYEAGERVAAAIATTGGALRGAANGWWALPSVGPGGACAAGASAFAAFRRDVPPTQCARAAARLDANTCDAWGGLRMLGDLRVAKFPTFDTLSVASNFVTLAITAAWSADSATGARTPLTSAAALTSATGNTINAFSSGAGGCSCVGVLVSVAYRVRYRAATRSITSVDASVVFSDVAQGAAACAAGTLVSTPLSWSVTWVDDAAAAPLTRSGAPGYLLGAPVLAGKAVSASGAAFSDVSALSSGDKVAIARSAPFGSRVEPLAALGAGEGFAVAGLSVRGAGPGGGCVAFSAGAAPGADAAWPVPVTFGEDMALSCSLSLAPADFTALCAAGAAPYVGLWAVNATGGAAEPTHVGQLGNADPAKYWQWVAIGGAGAPPVGTLDANFASCRGLATSFNLELLWAYVGEAGNPQAKVVAVRKRWGADTWVFSREDSRVLATGGAMEKQTFTFTTTVTWTQFPGQAPAQLVAAPPAVVPPLPSDLWYPFGQ
jgi:tectonic-1/3